MRNRSRVVGVFIILMVFCGGDWLERRRRKEEEGKDNEKRGEEK